MTPPTSPSPPPSRAAQATPPDPDRPIGRLTAIAAVGANGVIGDGRGLLWHLPADFARFKQVTWGGVLIQGRRTFDSIGRSLPGRQSIVISGDADFHPAGVLVAASVEAALAWLGQFPDRTWWSIGGGQTYRALWPYTTDLDITAVHQSPAGQVTFPPIDPDRWQETSRTAADGFDWVRYRRRQPDAAERLAAAVGRP